MSSLPALGKASNLGAPILPGDRTRKENTFLGLAGRFLPEHRWRAKAQLPCRPPTTSSQPALVLPLVSSGHPGVARDQEQFGSQKNINSCRFRKQEIEISVIELSLQRVRHNYKVKMENLSGPGAWKKS